MDTLRIQNVTLQNVGPFSSADLSFPPEHGLSLICGDNGIGKTTILEGIAATFSRGRLERLNRREGMASGNVSVSFLKDERQQTTSINLPEFKPGGRDTVVNPPGGASSRALINVRATRDLLYARQDAVSRDPILRDKEFADRVLAGLAGDEIKQWFSNRYLFRHHADSGSYTPEMLQNLDTAISFFSILDPNVILDRVDVRSFDIIVRTPTGKIPFEYLSSGFRSALFLLLGILKEIEFRGLGVAAKDFSGVILIDELDLHLHPTWQQQIGSILKEAYPRAQIIATTHSPHVIQSALSPEVIALVQDSGGSVSQRPIPTSKYGYAGWTVEEILEDIMGVADTKSALFRREVTAFDKALDEGDPAAIRSSLLTLRAMLHPKNPTRKLIEIQAAPFSSDEDLVEDKK